VTQQQWSQPHFCTSVFCGSTAAAVKTLCTASAKLNNMAKIVFTVSCNTSNVVVEQSCYFAGF
jgi:hypothetical protein